jgi:hypothetical protein
LDPVLIFQSFNSLNSLSSIPSSPSFFFFFSCKTSLSLFHPSFSFPAKPRENKAKKYRSLQQSHQMDSKFCDSHSLGPHYCLHHSIFMPLSPLYSCLCLCFALRSLPFLFVNLSSTCSNGKPMALSYAKALSLAIVQVFGCHSCQIFE